MKIQMAVNQRLLSAVINPPRDVYFTGLRREGKEVKMRDELRAVWSGSSNLLMRMVYNCMIITLSEGDTTFQLAPGRPAIDDDHPAFDLGIRCIDLRSLLGRPEEDADAKALITLQPWQEIPTISVCRSKALRLEEKPAVTPYHASDEPWIAGWHSHCQWDPDVIAMVFRVLNLAGGPGGPLEAITVHHQREHLCHRFEISTCRIDAMPVQTEKEPRLQEVPLD